MTKVRIQAKVNADSGWVELDPPRVRVPQGAQVIWAFSGVPKEFRPALLFESFIPGVDAPMGSADPSLGPFDELSRQGDEIHGSNFGGLAGEHMYKICLVAADGDAPLVRRLQCRNAPAGGLVRDPGPRTK